MQECTILLIWLSAYKMEPQYIIGQYNNIAKTMKTKSYTDQTFIHKQHPIGYAILMGWALGYL